MAFTPTREEYMTAFRGAPELVREATLSDDTVAIVEQIRAESGLHIDEMGQLGRYVNYLLLGLLDPEQFKKELLEIGIQENEAGILVAGINEKVFKPLQKKMRDGVQAETTDEEAFYDPYYVVSGIPDDEDEREASNRIEPVVPLMQLTQSSVAPEPFANPSSPASMQQNVPVYSHAAELINHQNTAIPAAVQPSTPQPVSSDASEPYLPYARTMAEDMERAAHGLTGQPATPARSFQTASVPVTFAQPRAVPAQETTYSVDPAPHTPTAPQFSAPQPSPTSQPIATPKYAVPTPPPAPTQPSAPVLAPVRLTPIDRPNRPNAPITKEFGSDPYREPISA